MRPCASHLVQSDAVSHLTCLDNRPMRIVAKYGREVQTFQEGDWTLCILSVGVSPVLSINASAAHEPQTCFLSVLVFSLCLCMCVALFEANSVHAGNRHLFVTVTDRISSPVTIPDYTNE